MKKKTIIKIAIIATVIILGLVFAYYENHHLVVTEYDIKRADIDQALDGYTIVQISDLHNASFGANNSRLIEKIKLQKPDMVVITGDIVDSGHTNINRAINFCTELGDICPSYYVTGNHEYWLEPEEYDELMTGIEKTGVKILNNTTVSVNAGETEFALIGLDDRNLRDNTLQSMILALDSDVLNIVLAHEPQNISSYQTAGADIVITGHAHGGQFRLPGIGGLVAPDQGFNPEYTEGIVRTGNLDMVISRGLGNSFIPIRLFNDPEVVVIKLYNK